MLSNIVSNIIAQRSLSLKNSGLFLGHAKFTVSFIKHIPSTDESFNQSIQHWPSIVPTMDQGFVSYELLLQY